MKNLYFDIETIPSQRADIKYRMFSEAQADFCEKQAAVMSKYKTPATIDKHLEALGEVDLEEKWRRTALDGGLGEIICIGFAIDEGPLQTVSRATVEESETDVLKEFFGAIGRELFRWIGHNITGFDLRFLWQRCVVLGVEPVTFIPYEDRSGSRQVQDLPCMWKGSFGKGYISHHDLCEILETGGKPDDINGSQVWDRFKEGDIARICEYCEGDVEQVRENYKKLKFGEVDDDAF